MRLIGWVMFAALSLAALPAAAAPAASVDAAQHGTKDEAVAMVKRVVDMFNKDGAEATFKAVDDHSNKDFHDRDLYPFIFTLSGDCVAHGARPAMIGKNFSDIKDQDGNYILHDILAIVKGPGSGWDNYKWINPTNNKIEDKSSYVEKLGDNYFVGVGVYTGE
jgi:cytochrome c